MSLDEFANVEHPMKAIIVNKLLLNWIINFLIKI